MAEKRYKSFILTDEGHSLLFFYAGHGAQNMYDDAERYFDKKFENAIFIPYGERSNEINYNKNPLAFTALVEAAVANGEAEYARIPKLGERWVVTPKQEEIPSTEQEQKESSPKKEYYYDAGLRTIKERPESSITVEGFRQIEDDRVGLPDDDDDYEPTEEEEMKHLTLMENGYDPSLGGEPGEVITDRDPGDEDDERDTAELPVIIPPIPDQYQEISDDFIVREMSQSSNFPRGRDYRGEDHPCAVQAIGGFPMESEGKIVVENTRKDQKPLEGDEKLPTEEEMEEEARRLREIPSPPRRDTGDLIAASL